MSSPYIDDLPPEIVDKIFAFVTDAPADASKTLWPREHPALLGDEDDIRPALLDAFNQPLVLRAVNRRWKAIVEGNPKVWSHLVGVVYEERDIPYLLRHLDMRIGWSRSMALSMYFADTSLNGRTVWSTGVIGEFKAFFRRHADRWVHLYLDTTPSLSRVFGPFTTEPSKNLVFPSLKALTLCWFVPVQVAYTAGPSAQLTTLRLHKQYIQSDDQPAGDILSHSLGSITTLDLGQFTGEEILVLLGQVCHRVVHCRVAVVAADEVSMSFFAGQPQTNLPGTPASGSSISRHIALPQLQTLDVGTPRRNGYKNVSFILDSLNVPNLTHLRAWFGDIQSQNHSRPLIAQSVTNLITDSLCASPKAIIVAETQSWNDERSCAEYVDSIYDRIPDSGVVAWLPGPQTRSVLPAFWEDVDTLCQRCFMSEMADDHQCPEGFVIRQGF